MAYWYLALSAIEWTLRLAMLPVVTRRRPASSAMAWLLIIFFQPIIGVVLYLLIGEYRLPRRRVRLHTRLNEAMVAVRRRFERHENIVHPDLRPDIYGPWAEQEPAEKAAQLTTALKPYGVTTGQVARRINGKTVNRTGFTRSHITEAIAERNGKRSAG